MLQKNISSKKITFDDKHKKYNIFNSSQHSCLTRKEKTLNIYDYYYLIKRGKKFLNPFIKKSLNAGLKAMIGLTYRCQCDCYYCGSDIYDKNKPEFSLDNFKNVIKEISNLPYFFICVSFTGGEPLLREDIFELINFTRKQGMLCEIESNGILLNSKNVKRLKNAGLHHIFISLDSINPADHEKIKKHNACYEKTTEGIKNCVQHNLSCSISTYASKRNISTGEINRIINLGKKLKVRSVRILPPVTIKGWNGRDNSEGLNKQEEAKLKSFLEPNFVYLESTKCNAPSAIKKCAFLDREFFYISPYGDIQPCPYFPVSFGNVARASLSEILKSMWDQNIFSTHNNTACLTNNLIIKEYFLKFNGRGLFPINYKTL
ncbi:MAG: radical SAM protein [Candidatus Omnitrophota bacterium]